MLETTRIHFYITFRRHCRQYDMKYRSSDLYGDLGNIFQKNLLRRFVISGLPVKWTVKSIKTAYFSGECTRRYESYRKELGEGEKERKISV